jgi:hypothetical protein
MRDIRVHIPLKINAEWREILQISDRVFGDNAKNHFKMGGERRDMSVRCNLKYIARDGRASRNSRIPAIFLDI